MNVKKVVAAVAGAAAVGNAVHAAFYKPQKKDVMAFERGEVNVERYRKNLSDAIKIKTISNRVAEDTDWNEFQRFHDFLDEAYPLIKANLEKEVVPPANLIYRWKGKDASMAPMARPRMAPALEAACLASCLRFCSSMSPESSPSVSRPRAATARTPAPTAPPRMPL